MENSDQAQEAYELARKHIAAAKEGGERVLCFSPTAFTIDGKTYPGDERFEHLTAVPAEIAGLTALQTLYFGGTQVADIAPLAGLTALQILALGRTQVADIAPLAGLTALQELSLWGTQVADIAPLAGLTALQTLYLEDTQVADIAPLAGLTTLQQLWLQNTKVADIAPLAGLTALQVLWLQDTQVADIAPLAGLENLRNLDFSNIPACAADPKLAELSEIEDAEERTRLTLAYLREKDLATERSGNETVIKPAVGKAGVTGHDATITTPDQVRTVQQGLAEAGFDPGPADGHVGDKTQQAMAAALEQGGLNSSGDILSDFNRLKDFLDKLSKSKSEPKPPPDETAPFYSDQPATQDLLNRRAVAETLGTIVDEVWNERRAAEKNEKREPHAGQAARDRTFIVHLHGRWGSGKTSILNFLREVLLSGKIAPQKPTRLQNWPVDPPWVVVEYNAWRNQGLGPAWWTLMDTVYREARKQLANKDPQTNERIWLFHLLWQLHTGWLPIIAGILSALVAIYLVLFFDPQSLGFAAGSKWGDIAKTLTGIIALFGSFFLLRGETGILNTRTAKRYMELARDPLGPLTRRYEAMISEIGRPVAVFIDDLDRCDAAFVVDLLQNIQTLFRSAPVLYVVAADRGWICTSYEQVYQDFTDNIGLPGKSMGHLFLEKVFQLSVEVPDLSKTNHEVFWEGLIRGADKADARPPPGPDADVDARADDKISIAPEKQKEIVSKITSLTRERDLIFEAKKQRDTPAQEAFARAEIFKQMQSSALRREQQHFLADYEGLVEKNPRAMKRLLNAYGFRRGFEIQSGIFREGEGEKDALVRWIILENRWPVLADHLSPGSAGDSDGEIIDALRKDSDFLEVTKGLKWDKLHPVDDAPTQPRD